MTNPATPRQTSFITSLVTERGYADPIDFGTLTSAEASGIISTLLAMPKLVSANRVTEQGVYQTADGAIYRVQASRESGNLYAKRLNAETAKFEYEAGALRNIKPADKMTLAEAKAFGIETGICCVCGRFLTDPISVAEGIGPVCAGRF